MIDLQKTVKIVSGKNRQMIFAGHCLITGAPAVGTRPTEMAW